MHAICFPENPKIEVCLSLIGWWCKYVDIFFKHYISALIRIWSYFILGPYLTTLGQEDRISFEFVLNQFGLVHFKSSQVNPQRSAEKNVQIAIDDDVMAIDDIET